MGTKMETLLGFWNILITYHGQLVTNVQLSSSNVRTIYASLLFPAIEFIHGSSKILK
jgi:hypothetical protein